MDTSKIGGGGGGGGSLGYQSIVCGLYPPHSYTTTRKYLEGHILHKDLMNSDPTRSRPLNRPLNSLSSSERDRETLWTVPLSFPPQEVEGVEEEVMF